MKHGHVWAIGLLGLALSACGGHGRDRGNGSVVTDEDLGLTPDYRIEAILTDSAVDPGFLYQDPRNLQINDNVTFQLVNYSGRNRSVAPTQANAGTNGVTFSTNDTLGATGALSTVDGTFNVSGTDSGNRTYIVTANYLGQNYSAYYKINPRLNQVRVRGRVVDGSGTPVYNAQIDFYRLRNPDTTREVVVSTVRTAIDGTFRASVPLLSGTANGATGDFTFTVRQAENSGTVFNYGGAQYDTGGTPRPSLSLAAGDATLDGDIVLAPLISAD